jgi:uncharacterized protein (DUF849 family)
MQEPKMDKFIITAAVTGAIHTPTMSSHLPITPDQIVEDALGAHANGAAIVHLHVRDPETGQPSADPELFGEILANIKSQCDVVVCTTTGGGLGQTTEERVRVVKTYSPELASLNAGSLNFALFPILDKIKDFKKEWESQYLAMSEDFIFPNTFKTLRQFSQFFTDEDTRPEFEIYDAGMLSNLAFLISQGWVTTPVYLQFVLGILGGMQATVNNLVRGSLKSSSKFKVCPYLTNLLMGGNTRVGLEDNLYLEKGVMAKSSAEQVEKIIRIGKEHGLEPATPNEAREILHLKGRDKVKF